MKYTIFLFAFALTVSSCTEPAPQILFDGGEVFSDHYGYFHCWVPAGEEQFRAEDQVTLSRIVDEQGDLLFFSGPVEFQNYLAERGYRIIEEKTRYENYKCKVERIE